MKRNYTVNRKHTALFLSDRLRTDPHQVRLIHVSTLSDHSAKIYIGNNMQAMHQQLQSRQ